MVPDTYNEHEKLQDELSDLKHELEHFQQEKERVRAIIGKIGGVPKFRTKLINASAKTNALSRQILRRCHFTHDAESRPIDSPEFPTESIPHTDADHQ